MSYVIRMLTGIIKGLSGHDVEELLDDIVKKFGVEIGQIIRELLGSKGESLKIAEQKLADFAVREPEVSSQLVAVITSRADETDTNRFGSLISGYILALNYIVDKMQKTNRALLLRGFLHTKNCASLWVPSDSAYRTLTPFSTSKSLERIYVHESPIILIADEIPTDEQLRDLNLKIRHNGYGALNDKFGKGVKVDWIEEFSVVLEHPSATLAIQDNGCTGIDAMIKSLVIALDAQGEPHEELFSKLNDLGLLD